MFDAGRLYKDIATLEIRLFDTFHTLHINVQNANASRSAYIGNSFFAKTVKSSKILEWLCPTA